MKKIFFVLFILLQYLILPQELKKTTFIEANVIKNNSDYSCYLTFRVNYNAIVFVKDGTKFKSGFSINFEVSDSNKIIKREIVKKQVEVNNYDITNSYDSSIVGMMVINLTKGKYVIKPYIELNNTSLTIPQEPIYFDLETKDDSICSRPLLVQEKLNSTELVNYGGFLPYSDNKYNLIIPVKDLSVKEISFDITQNNEVLFSKTITKSINSDFTFYQNNNSILVKFDSSKKDFNLFEIENISSIVDEGKVDLTIKINNIIKKYSFISNWLNKPDCLKFPDFAIKSMNLFVDDEVINELLHKNSDNYYIELKKFWNKYFPPDNSKYNKKMLEFYTRVDYTLEKFITNGKRGNETDRGIIYIKYGNPDKIERTYTERDNTIEIWYYNKIGKKFLFKDITGLGNFTLLK